MATFLQEADFIRSLYIVAFALFIYGLSLLTGPNTAVRGNRIAAVGMAVAVAATLLSPGVGDWGLIVLGVVVGTAVGVPAARSVKMTAIPQMVALFNGVGGGAVALIAWVEFRETGGFADTTLAIVIPSMFGAIVGSISFWGSNIAFGKLQEILPRPPDHPRPRPAGGQPGAAARSALAGAVAICTGSTSQAVFIGVLVAAALLGNFLVLPIGGADMPVVISLLNAFTGLSAAGDGHRAQQHGADRRGHDRRRLGHDPHEPHGERHEPLHPEHRRRGLRRRRARGRRSGCGLPEGATVRSTSAADAAIQLSYARKVIVVPGYGMAVAQAQHTVKELAAELEKRGIEVSYAIHPVAGRMPGHMNVLLAEADVPYDQLKEMDEINGEFSRTDVSLVIGANDVTNPAANSNPDSPIYGMPILNVNESDSVIVLKRSMNPGFAGIDNELYYDAKTQMLFGDAKASVADVTSEVQAL